MNTKTKEKNVLVTGNFKEGIEPLIKEYQGKKMPQRKYVALREKLIGHFKKEELTGPERDFLLLILKRERHQGTISKPDWYMLSAYEWESALGRCIVKDINNPPRALHLKIGMPCRYIADWEKDRYAVYAERTIPPEHQLNGRAASLHNKGEIVPDSLLPKEKKVIHYFNFTAKEFDAWFERTDESPLEMPAIKPASEVDYEF